MPHSFGEVTAAQPLSASTLTVTKAAFVLMASEDLARLLAAESDALGSRSGSDASRASLAVCDVLGARRVLAFPKRMSGTDPSSWDVSPPMARRWRWDSGPTHPSAESGFASRTTRVVRHTVADQVYVGRRRRRGRSTDGRPGARPGEASTGRIDLGHRPGCGSISDRMSSSRGRGPASGEPTSCQSPLHATGLSPRPCPRPAAWRRCS
jgi:hypothetical protein